MMIPCSCFQQLEGRDSLKGFIIRGFKSNGSPGGRFVNMNSNSDARIMPCSGQSSVTHANSGSKSSVKLQVILQRYKRDLWEKAFGEKPLAQ